jgi:hypothetical protein
MRSSWLLDSGASCHMTEAWELFRIMMERDTDVHVYVGDDARYAVKGERMVTFQLELGGLLDSHYALYVPGLKKIFLSVSPMEDRGFFVTSHRGKILIHLEKAILDTTMVIGAREVTLYRLQGNPIQDLVHDSENLCELWHKRLGELHYRALLIQRGIVTGLPKFNIE